MFVKDRNNGHLVEVIDRDDLMDPVKSQFKGRYNWGEDLPDPEQFKKSDIIFPSGEPLPRCWLDVHYRDNELPR
ncbi:acetyltransferase [Thioalkalivibrio denitrificans]|uniref:Acetyltransferase n=1 Tax=Thioalkalivibrio denitrificans TaxID=108003 RepID=A0A1V3NBW1_9GAMM|nr:acetyltransferase [Thioalkalivibrio denitrificans]OOG22338.1 acetyltransferase [Thioalkalivibrio denitrificans]